MRCVSLCVGSTGHRLCAGTLDDGSVPVFSCEVPCFFFMCSHNETNHSCFAGARVDCFPVCTIVVACCSYFMPHDCV